jgi:DNA-binding transcriptional LysR family regulator
VKVRLAFWIFAETLQPSVGVGFIMSQTTAALGQMRLGDLFAFLAVKSSGSITGAARELRVTPSQVSKAITRLEHLLRVRLLSRSSRGVALSAAGRRMAPLVEQAVVRLKLLGREDNDETTELTLAAPSWLVTQFLPAIAAAHPELKMRGLEIPPALIRAYAAENFFDVTILTSDIDRLPGAWASTRVGDVRKALFANPVLAKKLGPQPVPAERLHEVPFICPIYHRDGQFMAVDDDCPIGPSDRKIGHQAQTIGLALELACITDQLVFGPFIAARRFVQIGALTEITVEGWSVNEPLYVICNGDRVLSRVEKCIVKALKASLRDFDPA